MAEAQVLDSERLRAEVISLSCYLTAYQGSRSNSHPKDPNWRFFNDLSTLLAIGNSSNYEARNVNAVMGICTPDTIDHLIFAENARQDSVSVARIKTDLKHGPQHNQTALPRGRPTPTDSSWFVLSDIYPSDENGKKLLSEWVGQHRGEKVVPNDYQFPAHLRDLLDVIFSLDSSSNNLIEFDLFIHHRAYRKLGWRVLEFLTHWGESPFDILLRRPDPKLKTKTFEIKGRSRETLTQHIKIPAVSVTSSGLLYHVDGANAHDWLLTLKRFWDQLEDHLLVVKSETKKKVRKDCLTPSAVEDVVSVITFLESLLPIFKYLLSGQGVARSLADAENKQYHLKDDDLPLLEDGEEVDYELELRSNNYPVTIDQSVDRLLRAVKTVLAWHICSRHVHKRAPHFRTLTAKFSEFRYGEQVLQPHALSLSTFSSLITEWRAPVASPYDAAKIKRIYHSTLDAKVHAEAALMHWVATDKDPLATKIWPIGVSKKCCQSCWLLHEAYNGQRVSSSFVLPGTHATFYPWVPPPGLPSAILYDLRSKLLDASQKMVRTHSRHSSADSGDSDSVIPHGRSRLQGGLMRTAPLK